MERRRRRRSIGRAILAAAAMSALSHRAVSSSAFLLLAPVRRRSWAKGIGTISTLPAAMASAVSRDRTLSRRGVASSAMENAAGHASWNEVFPLEKGSHNSARLVIPPRPSYDRNKSTEDKADDPFGRPGFRSRLGSTLKMCKEMGKSSLWVDVPMSRSSLVEVMSEFGLRFHHAEGDTAVLNVWLKEGGPSKIPLFATHNVGVGGLVINSRNEILCVRELRRNYLPWKTPTGLADLGESIEDAAVREVYEETGIRTKFRSVVGFRQTHGLAHGRSDLFFVCHLDPIEDVDERGNVVIPEPVIQPCEIETAEWIPLDEYRAMVNGCNDDHPVGHPMMRHVLASFDAGRTIECRVVESVVPGRAPNSIFYPT